MINCTNVSIEAAPNLEPIPARRYSTSILSGVVILIYFIYKTPLVVKLMKEDKFLEENIEKWDKLSNYNEKIKSKGMANLNKDEIQEFTDLYRATSHNLAYAQTNFPSSNIITYINQIIGTSHNYIFVREKTNYNGIKYYLTKGFTKAIHDNYKYILGSFLLFTFAMIFMIILVFINRDYGNIFYPNITGDMLNTDGDSIDSVLYPFLSSFIITNNIKVSFISFILEVTRLHSSVTIRI